MLARELTLEDMLAEPIVKLLMDRDGVDEAELRSLMRSTPSSVIATPRSNRAGPRNLDRAISGVCCLTAAMMPRIRRDHDETNETEPLSGLQGVTP
jgi:hypothetical protein